MKDGSENVLRVADTDGAGADVGASARKEALALISVLLLDVDVGIIT